MNVYYSVEEKLLKADMYMYDSNYVKAHRMFTEILQEEPDSALAHYGMGVLMRYHLQNITQAEEHFRLALQFKPDYTFAAEEYVLLLYHLKDFAKLEAFAPKALLLPGIKASFVLQVLGNAAEACGELEKALALYEEGALKSTDSRAFGDLKDCAARIKAKLLNERRPNYLLG